MCASSLRKKKKQTNHPVIHVIHTNYSIPNWLQIVTVFETNPTSSVQFRCLLQNSAQMSPAVVCLLTSWRRHELLLRRTVDLLDDLASVEG